MSRHVISALIVVLAVFGIGLALRDWALPRHATLQTLPASAPPPIKVEAMTVKALRGVVELRGAATENWQPLTVDAHVSDHDALRTSDGASATIAAGDGLRLELAEKSQLTLSKLADGASTVWLETGRIAAQVRGTMRVQVAVKGSDAVVDSAGHGDAAFSVLRSQDARVSVVTTEGSVGLQANNTRVEVPAGSQSVVAAHGTPSAPSRIPASLFLKVARSGPARVNRRETDVSGSTTPGAEVFVNGTHAPVDDEGKFKTRVPLREGVNSLEVSAHDALGREQHQVLPNVHVDTQAPKLVGQVVW